MEKSIKSYNIIIGIVFILFGLGFIILIKLYEVLNMYVFFEGTSISYFVYQLYRNVFIIGISLIGIGGIFILIKKLKTKIILLSIFTIIMSILFFNNIIRKPIKNYKPFMVKLKIGLTDNELFSLLSKNGFKKVIREVNKDEYGKPKIDYHYYPYYFKKTDSINFYEYIVDFKYYSPTDLKNDDMRGLISNLTINIYQSENKNLQNYSTFKKVFDYYFCQFEQEYNQNPYVNYPYLRTFSYGSYGKGSSLSISKKNDLISYTWPIKGDTKFTILNMYGLTGGKLEELSRDNTVINIAEAAMYISIEQSIFSYYYDKDNH